MALKITKDTTIQDALTLGDEAFDLLGRYFGPGCLACGAAAFETLEMGVLSHGLGEEKLPELIAALQKLSDQPAKKLPEVKAEARSTKSEARNNTQIRSTKP